MSAEKYAKKELLQLKGRAPTRVSIGPVEGLINLGAGDPDFNLPKFMADAVAEAIMEGYTHYEFQGDSEFKKAVAEYYSKYGVKLDAESQVLVTSGGSQSIFHILAAFLNPGEEVIIFNPTYHGYVRPIKYFNGIIVRAPMKKDEEGYFRPDIEALEAHISDKTKILILCNPDNPTGCVFKEDELKAIAELAVKHDFLILSDEIYNEFIWGNRRHYPIILVPGMMERTLVAMSFSKMFAWTGCRLGFIISGSEFIEILSRVPMGICSVPVPFRRAGVVALKEGWEFNRMMREKYWERIKYCVERLNEIPGISCVTPEATFYLFPDISGTGMSSEEFSKRLLEEEKVRIVQGTVYGSNGEGHVRLALVKPLETLREAMDRIEKFVRKNIK
ncbi:MAG TPA: pyridoxal phosphate-dependent aminotransferase [Candidatus Bathyarchaeota archaeon]|nr:pyridoxal phosphate-dependent aminotransferase [Candidatus Bathyarchaeota archaeon]